MLELLARIVERTAPDWLGRVEPRQGTTGDVLSPPMGDRLPSDVKSLWLEVGRAVIGAIPDDPDESGLALFTEAEARSWLSSLCVDFPTYFVAADLVVGKFQGFPEYLVINDRGALVASLEDRRDEWTVVADSLTGFLTAWSADFGNDWWR